MKIPARILRSQIDEFRSEHYRLSPKDIDLQDRIVKAAQAVMARHGRSSVTLASLALAMRISPATIRRLFCDLDSILAEILVRHLQAIAAALGKVPFDSPNAQAARRAAYLAYTRTPYNAPTEAHILLLRDRHGLPEDLAESIENIRLSIGSILAGYDAGIALTLLDTTDLQGPQIEAMLATLAPAAAAPEPAASPPPPQPEPAAKLRLVPPQPDPALVPDTVDLARLRRHTPPIRPNRANQARAGPA